jgi:hypothetical protein
VLNNNRIRISSYTKDGFSSLIQQFSSKSRKIVVLKGKFGCHYTNLLQMVVQRLHAENRNVVILQHSLIDAGIEGLFVEDKGILIIEEKLLTKSIRKPLEEINMNDVYEESIVLSQQREISNLELNIKTNLQFVMKHFSEASSFIKGRDTLINKLTNKQLLASKRNHLIDSIFKSNVNQEIKPSNEKRFIEPNSIINLPVSTNYNVSKNSRRLFLRNNYANYIMEEIERKAKDENLRIVRYVSPIFPLQTSLLWIPELEVIIYKRIAVNDLIITGEPFQEIDFSHCLTSQYYDFTTKKKINDLEANCSIKLTLALNYLKEAKQRYSDLASIYGNAKVTENENVVANKLMQAVK